MDGYKVILMLSGKSLHDIEDVRYLLDKILKQVDGVEYEINEVRAHQE